MELDTKILLGGIVILLISLVFIEGIITLIVLYPLNVFPLEIVFEPRLCETRNDGTKETPETDGCTDPAKFEGSEILNCLHGGLCPAGVTYVEDEPVIDDTDVDSTVTNISNCTPPLVEINNRCVSEPHPIGDADGDGILDNVDACIFDAETINGILDTDGCPEIVHGELPSDEVLTTEQKIDIIDVLINPPQVLPPIFTETQTSTDVPIVNLNESVNNAIVIYIVLFAIIALIIGILFYKKYRN